MRNCTLFLFFVAFIGQFQTQAQSHGHLSPCGVEQPGMEMDHTWLRDYQQHPENYSTNKNAALIVAALQVHNVGDDNGTGYFPMESMLIALANLQYAYLDSDIQFYLTNGINYIDNTAWNNHETFGLGSQMMSANQVSGMLNTFITTEAAGNCGYYSPGVDASVVDKGCAGVTGQTWAHELGHYLSLPHTFYGWEGIDYDKNVPTSNYQNDVFTSIEKVDGSNCDGFNAAADGFCDTPPDYISSRWNCTDNGDNGVDYFDTNGDAFRVDGGFYMSYSNGACKDRFSQEQSDAMRANIEFQREDIILDIEIEEVDIADFNPIFPIENEEVAYNYVKLEWDPIPGATHYLVQIELYPFGVVRVEKVVTATELITTELQAGRNYNWKVRPFNWGYFFAPFSDDVLFRTNETVATQEIEGVEGVQVFPTMVSNGQALNIQFEAVENIGEAEISLTSLTGVRHQVEQVFIQNGQNQFAIQPKGLNGGIYIVGVTTEQGSFYQKVVVQ